MRNIVRELDLDDYDDEDYLTIERFDRKQGFEDESYHKERRGDTIRRKRKQKERERQKMIKESERDSEQTMEMEKYQRVRKRLKEHLEEALSNLSIYDWFMIAVNGSYNYGMDTPESDVDSKLLVIPSFEQLVSGKSLNQLYCMKDNGEHVEVKDIRHYFHTMLKQNVNFVETLYAQVWIINPHYLSLFSMLFDMRDVISGCNPKAAINCIQGTVKQKRIQMVHDSPGRHDSIMEYGYDTKSFHHLMRLSIFGLRYMDGIDYQECLLNNSIPNVKEHILAAKNPRGHYPLRWIEEDADFYVSELDKRVQKYLEALRPFEQDYTRLAADVRDILDTLAFEIIKRAIYKEYNG